VKMMERMMRCWRSDYEGKTIKHIKPFGDEVIDEGKGTVVFFTDDTYTVLVASVEGGIMISNRELPAYAKLETGLITEEEYDVEIEKHWAKVESRAYDEYERLKKKFDPVPEKGKPK